MNVINFNSLKRFYLFLLQYRSLKTVDHHNYYDRKIIKVGDKVEFDKVITEKDLDLFTEISGDVNPVHINEPKVFHGAYLNMLVSFVMGTKLPGPGCLLVKQNMRFPHACYVNQKVTVTVEVSEVKRIITCNYSVYSHKDKVPVMEGQAKLLIKGFHDRK